MGLQRQNVQILSSLVETVHQQFRTRSLLLIVLWAFLFAWFFRLMPQYSGPVVPTGFAAMNDFIRYQIATSGGPATPHALRHSPTIQAELIGGVADNWHVFLTGTLSVMVGGELPFGQLRRLYWFPVVGLVALPATIAAWARRYHREPFSKRKLLLFALVVAVTVTPALREIFRTSTLRNLGPYSTVLLLLTALQIPRIASDRRRIFVFGFLTFSLMTAHHTWMLIGLIIFCIYFALSGLVPINLTRSISISQGLLVFLFFFLAGSRFNTGLHELVLNLYSTVLSPASSAYFELSQQQFQKTTSIGSITSSVRKFGKIGYRFLYLLAIMVFVVNIGYRTWNQSWDSVPDSAKTLFYFLITFPFLLLGFYRYGGIPAAVGRTEYVGVYFAIIILLWLFLRGPNRVRQRIPQLALVLIVLISASTLAHPATFNSTHSYADAASLEQAGTEIPSDRYVFSDTSMAYTLMYFDHYSIVTIRRNFDSYRRLVRRAYGGTPSQRRQAIQKTIKQSAREQIDKEPYYVLVSQRMETRGVSFLTFSVNYPEDGTVNGFGRGFSKISDSGTGELYTSRWTNRTS